MERFAIHPEQDNIDRTITVEDNLDLDSLGSWLDTAGKVANTYTQVKSAIEGGAHPASSTVQQLIKQAPTNVPPPSPTGGSSNTTLWIVGGVVSVVILIVIVYFATRK